MLAWIEQLGTLGITIVVFLLIFGGLIILHEFGHFWAARAAKVKILEFGIGLPPKIFAKNTTRTLSDGSIETMQWTINALPFGGFVRMLGEEGGSKDPYAFANRPWGWKVLVICGGVIMNFIIGWILLSGLLWVGGPAKYTSEAEYKQLVQNGYFLEINNVISISGDPKKLSDVGLKNGDIVENPISLSDLQSALNKGNTTINIQRWNAETKILEKISVPITNPIDFALPKLQIGSLVEGSLAQQIGLQTNDIITGVNNTPIFSAQELSFTLENITAGSEALIKILRNNQSMEMVFTVPTSKKLGIYSAPNTDSFLLSSGTLAFPLKNQSFGILESLQKGFIQSFSVVEMSWKMLKNMIEKVKNGGGIPDEMGGPVAIAHTTGQILEFGNISMLIYFTAMISLSLAFMNILPLPALDGGRLLFLLLEGILIIKTKVFAVLGIKNYGGEKLPESIEGYFHMIGYLLLMSLLLLITWNDIMRIFFGK